VTRLGRAPSGSITADAGRPAEPLTSREYLLARLGMVEARVRVAVDRRRVGDPDPDDPVRGMYVDDGQVDAMLAGGDGSLGIPPAADGGLRRLEADADAAEAADTDLRLRRLLRTFDLDQADGDILLAVLAPDLDLRYERLYAYLHDDITQKRASVGLALELAGVSPADTAARARLGPDGPLAAGGLLVLEEPHRPFLSRALRVPDRVTAFLLGADRPDVVVTPLLTAPLQVPIGGSERLTRGLSAGVDLAYVRDRNHGTGPVLGAAALAGSAWSVLEADLGRLPAGTDGVEAAGLLAREAALAGGGLVAGPLEAVDRAILPPVVRALASAPVPVVLVGAPAWEPDWSERVPLQVAAPEPDAAAKEASWARALEGEPRRFDVGTATAGLRLTPRQMQRAARSARLRAVAEGRPLEADHLRAAIREQNAGRLEDLARRIEPAAGFMDVVLPARALASLHEIIDRTRHRHRVVHEWGLGGPGSRQRGVTALFSGGSGTGKTLAAEVVAHELGLDLYTIDLSAVVDKYVGETEKNLDRIFTEAEDVNGVLFFDEADALFGKRSEVADAHDRYANIETAFLLQRVESFDGIAVLATNLRANLDEAFSRRLDVLIAFPEPEEAARRKLWELHLPEGLPLCDDLDLDHLARTFRVTGGDIRNITLTAAYEAAAAGDGPLTMSHLLAATVREFRKLGRLVSEKAFGPNAVPDGETSPTREEPP
jgi:hypothetical protein